MNVDGSNGAGMTSVSVVTICRNARDVIEATMVSVLEQTYARLEYLVIDGASSDDTLDVVERVRARFPQREVLVVSEPDQGIADAMNKGVLLSTGDVLVHLHAGDRFVDPSIIDRVVASHRADGWRWAVASSIVVDELGTRRHVYRPNPDYRSLVRKNTIPNQSTFLLRDVFTRNGLFRVDLRQGMDYEFWVRIAFLGGERYAVLPVETTYFLTGGYSGRIVELLRYVAMIRRELRRKGVPMRVTDDVVFLGRIALFWAQAEALEHARSACRRR